MPVTSTRVDMKPSLASRRPKVLLELDSVKVREGLGPIDIQDSNRLRDVIHEFPESNLELVGWPGGMN